MSFVAISIAIIIALAICLVMSFIENDRMDKALKEARDKITSLMIGKKLIIKKNYMRNDEMRWLTILEKLFGKDYILKPQVHLSDIADVKFGYYDHDNLFYELKRIIIDVVIFDKKYQPLLGIEINGDSHLLSFRKHRDCLVENLLNNIGMEYFEIQSNKFISEEKFKELVENKIKTVEQGLVRIKATRV